MQQPWHGRWEMGEQLGEPGNFNYAGAFLGAEQSRKRSEEGSRQVYCEERVSETHSSCPRGLPLFLRSSSHNEIPMVRDTLNPEWSLLTSSLV